MFVYWEPLDQERLRGHVNNQTFRVITSFTNSLTRENNFTVEGLSSSSNYTIKVLVSNGVLESPRAVASARTFDLPPSPEVMEDSLTNTSLTAMLRLINNEAIDLLTGLGIRIENTQVIAIYKYIQNYVILTSAIKHGHHLSIVGLGEYHASQIF